MTDNVFETVLASRTSPRSNSQASAGEIQIVANNQQVIHFELIKVDRLADALATRIHVRVWAKQHELYRATGFSSHAFGKLAFESSCIWSCRDQGGHFGGCHEPNIMPCLFVLATWVSKSNDQLHYVLVAIGIALGLFSIATFSFVGTAFGDHFRLCRFCSRLFVAVASLFAFRRRYVADHQTR